MIWTWDVLEGQRNTIALNVQMSWGTQLWCDQNGWWNEMLLCWSCQCLASMYMRHAAALLQMRLLFCKGPIGMLCSEIGCPKKKLKFLWHSTHLRKYGFTVPNPLIPLGVWKDGNSQPPLPNKTKMGYLCAKVPFRFLGKTVEHHPWKIYQGCILTWH